jgi:hypothetical protein
MSAQKKKQLKKIKPRNWVVPLMRQTRKPGPFKAKNRRLVRWNKWENEY